MIKGGVDLIKNAKFLKSVLGNFKLLKINNLNQFLTFRIRGESSREWNRNFVLTLRNSQAVKNLSTQWKLLIFSDLKFSNTL
jgi:hypothetical protein